MQITETELSGLFIITPKIFEDNRGYFLESYNFRNLDNFGIIFNPVQDNESKSIKNVIRGLHYQLKPFDQAKLIRVIEGKIFDVALDLRKSSKTFGKWFGIELDSKTKKQLFISKGFAHGFSVLSETATIQYKCDNFYNPESERGISIFDNTLNINWRININDSIISTKDRENPLLRDAEINFI
jgi:dTDP-4-dehydrorhamnose 3,5-epimerase